MPKKQYKSKKHDNAGHRERLRERLLEFGIGALSDHEIIELLLFYTMPRVDTKPKAKQILDEFGSLHNLFETDPYEIKRRAKVSIITAILFSLILPLFRRYNISKSKNRKLLRTSASLQNYIKSLFLAEPIECFYLLCFDARVRLVHTGLIARGTINRAELYPREIICTAMRHDTRYIIMAHNHPSGDTEASADDIRATTILMNLFEAIDVTILDHIIVTNSKCVSFSQQQILGMTGIDGVKGRMAECDADLVFQDSGAIDIGLKRAEKSANVADGDKKLN